MTSHDYFHGEQADQFSFYKIPKILFEEEEYMPLSVMATTLYAVLLDRMSLSAKNKWLDEKGRVYIIFTIEELKHVMKCGENKVEKLLKELEKCDLIEKKRFGLGIPNRIYVKNFISNQAKGQLQTWDNHNLELEKSQVQNWENHNSRVGKNTNLELVKSQSNNTDINNTNFSNTEFSKTEEELIYPSINHKDISKGNVHNFENNRIMLEKHLDLGILLENYPDDADTINLIFQIIFDTFNSTMKTFRISGGDVPAEIVKARLLSLNHMHIEYVMACLRKTTTKINNLPSYVLTSLYQAPSTMDAYYRNLVQHDLYGKRG